MKDGTLKCKRYFSDIGKAYLSKLHQNATEKVSKWVATCLEPFFLSDYFNDANSIEEVKRHLVSGHDEDYLPVYEVNLSPTSFNYWMLIIQYLNLLNKDIKWDVPTAINNYGDYLKSLEMKENTTLVLDCTCSSYVWVRLDNVDALIRESGLMHHCVARDDLPHVEQLLKGQYIFLSLRGPGNCPHVTLKYNPRSRIVVDLVGKQNSIPDEKYDSCTVDIMNHLGLIPQNPRTQPYRRFVLQDDQWSLQQVESNG